MRRRRWRREAVRLGEVRSVASDARRVRSCQAQARRQLPHFATYVGELGGDERHAADGGGKESRARRYAHGREAVTYRPTLSRTPFVLALPTSIRTRPQGDATTVICRDNCPWLSGNRDTHVAVLAMTLWLFNRR